MREAADILSTPSAMQIRYLDTLNSISKAPQMRIVFLPPGNGTEPAALENNGKSSAMSPLQAQNYFNLSQ